MYKICTNIRNRLACSTKFISALRKHANLPFQLYVYDNCTNTKINEHFMYWSLLYQKGIVQQVTFNTKESTFNAFSKAAACNQFGLNHEQDPNKDSYDFLLFVDNDIILTPGFDVSLRDAWLDVKKYKMDNIKIISQLPGGIKNKKPITQKIGGFNACTGQSGGSGLWSVRTNFFKDIGYLDLKELIGLSKKHDQLYWKKLGLTTRGKDYILGLETKLGIHTGKISGSICNTLARNKNLKQKNVEELIKFEEAEKRIDSMTFDEFYKMIKDDKTLMNDW